MKTKCVGEGRDVQKVRFLNSRERKCSFSLDFWEIGPSDFFGTRRTVALRGEDYAWAPVLSVSTNSMW